MVFLCCILSTRNKNDSFLLCTIFHNDFYKEYFLHLRRITTPIFMKKLPQELKLSFTRKVPIAEWNIDKILEVLRDELEARERALSNDTRSRSRPSHSNSTHGSKRGRDYPTTGAYTSSSEEGCCYCRKEGHSPTNCKRVTNIDKRKRLKRESGRCFNSLRKGHIGTDCHSSSKCSNCNGRHHTSICMGAST